MQLLKLNEIKKKIEKYKDFIYIFPLILFIITSIFSNKTDLFTSFENGMSIIRYMCLFIIIFKILLFDIKEYSKKTYINILILSIMAIIISIKVGNRLLIQYLILVLGAYKVPFEKIVKYVLIGEGITILLIILSGVVGIIPNYAFERKEQGVVRYALGFEFSSYPAIFVYYLTMLYLYYRKDKLKIIEYLILISINVVIYILTDTRTELICSILLIVMAFIYNKYKFRWFDKIIIFLSKFLMPIITVISIILAYVYNPTNIILSTINKALSGRLTLAKQGMKKFGITLLGNKIEWISLNMVYSGENQGNSFNYVDNGYLNIIYNYGILTLLFILYGFYKVIKEEVKNNNTYLCCFIIILAIHSFITPQLLQIVYNIFILLLVNVIIKPKSEEISQDKQEKEEC